MDPNRTRIYLSLEVPYEAKFFAFYGGDDGARTRDLCRDSEPENCNLLKQCVTDGPFLALLGTARNSYWTLIGPVSSDPRPLPICMAHGLWCPLNECIGLKAAWHAGEVSYRHLF